MYTICTQWVYTHWARKSRLKWCKNIYSLCLYFVVWLFIHFTEEIFWLRGFASVPAESAMWFRIYAVCKTSKVQKVLTVK